jgi:hypothetical protein
MDSTALYWTMEVNYHAFPITAGKRFVLIGLPFSIEETENPDYDAANAIRKHLYKLARPTESGQIIDPKVNDGVHYLLDEEALLFVSKMPPWIPALKNGNSVSCSMIMPITFQLNSN